MSIEINSNIPEVVTAIQALDVRFNEAVQYANRMIALKVEGLAVKNANTGHHPFGQGHIPGTGPGPNTMTTSLMKSIHAEEVVGFGDYRQVVGATTEYARAVEEGSPKWKSGVKYPYMRPAADRVRPEAANIFVAALTSRLRG